MSDYIDIVFDGPPGAVPGRFVEAENPAGASVNAGEWIDRGDGHWALRIPAQPATVRADITPSAGRTPVDAIRWRHTSYSADLADMGPVTQMMGNGRRTIVPKQAEVTVFTGREGVYVTLRGPQILRNGEEGRYLQTGWSIGGPWDESSTAPAIVHELLRSLAERGVTHG